MLREDNRLGSVKEVADIHQSIWSFRMFLAKKLEQSTTQVRFAEVDLAYLDFRPKAEESEEVEE
jgi:hypothetical protein